MAATRADDSAYGMLVVFEADVLLEEAVTLHCGSAPAS
jgi:hypothetical protein